MPFCERYSFTWLQNIQPCWEYTTMLFVTVHLPQNLRHLKLSAEWRPLLRQSRHEPDGQNRPVGAEHPATASQTHILRCSPRPRLNGCAHPSNEIKPFCGPNTVSRAGPECVPARRSKELQNR